MGGARDADLFYLHGSVEVEGLALEKCSKLYADEILLAGVREDADTAAGNNFLELMRVLGVGICVVRLRRAVLRGVGVGGGHCAGIFDGFWKLIHRAMVSASTRARSRLELRLAKSNRNVCRLAARLRGASVQFRWCLAMRHPFGARISRACANSGFARVGVPDKENAGIQLVTTATRERNRMQSLGGRRDSRHTSACEFYRLTLCGDCLYVAKLCGAGGWPRQARAQC